MKKLIVRSIASYAIDKWGSRHMKITIEGECEYDTGIHPDVSGIVFCREKVEKFFEGNRFPNLVKIRFVRRDLTRLVLDCPSVQGLSCSFNHLTKLELNCPSLQNLCLRNNQLTELELNCPSLQKLQCNNNRLTKLELNCPALQGLYCEYNQLVELELNCPSLKKLVCGDNQLTRLELNCPSLKYLWCYGNQLTDLNGLEFCTSLKSLACSEALKESVEILKFHLPDLNVKYG